MSDIDPQDFGALTAKVEGLEKAVDKLAGDIERLVGMAERSRGALWAGMTLAGLFGGIVTWAVGKLLGVHP